MVPSLARIVIVAGMVAPVSASITRPAMVAGWATVATRRNAKARTANLRLSAIGPRPAHSVPRSSGCPTEEAKKFHLQVGDSFAEKATLALRFASPRVIHRHAPNERRRGYQTSPTQKPPPQDAALAEQGATVAPEKASSKKGGSQKTATSGGQKTAKGKLPGAHAKKGAKAKKGARKAGKSQASRNAARRQQGFEDPGADRTAQRRDPGRDQDGHGLAGAQRARLSLHSKKRGLKIESTKTEAG